LQPVIFRAGVFVAAFVIALAGFAFGTVGFRNCMFIFIPLPMNRKLP
jgi:hypothetical protein